MSLVAKSPYVHFLNDAGTSVYHGKCCVRCGNTLRYTGGHKCVGCMCDRRRQDRIVKRVDGVILSPPLHLINRAWA